MKTQTAEWSFGCLTTRFGTFALLGLVVLVCMVSTGCEPNAPPESIATDTKPGATFISQESAEAAIELAVNEVAVSIDTMMCVEGCFNSVKELLEKRPGIMKVRLAPQKEEGTIDNSMIYIKHLGELDKAEMERLILGAGFKKMEFVK
jgi:copper chaperone CopZ